MRNAFESTVLDLPRHMLIQYPHLVHDAHVAVVVAELTLAATRDTIRVLAWLKSNAPQTKVVVVANGVPSGGALEISRKDFEQSIERPDRHRLPVRRQACRAGGQARQAARGSRKRQDVGAVQHAVERRPQRMPAKKARPPNPRAVAGAKSLLGNLKAMLSKPKDKAA